MKLYCNSAAYYLKIKQRQTGKPNLLLLHGFMGSIEGITPLAERLKSIFNPIIIDLLGHARSDAVSDSRRYEAASQVDDLKSILSRLRLTNLWLYGYSMGGRLAQNLILDSPDSFSGLILESTHCGLQDPDKRKKRWDLDDQRANEIEENFDLFVKKWASLPLFNSPDEAQDFDYLSIIKKQSPYAMAASLRGFGAGTAPFVCDQMQQLQKPIGLIAGKSDEKYVDKMREMHHLFPDSKFFVTPGAGHRVHVDQPEQIETFLTNFLETHD